MNTRVHIVAMTGVFCLLAAAGYAALFIAPDEATMHVIQRIFYFHVPCGMTGLLTFCITFFANVAYLVTRKPKWDWLGVASAEVGLVFVTAVLVTGPIWAHPAWGVWWAWDWRLTSTLVMWILYVCYLLLRSLLGDPERRAVFSAVFGVFAGLDVPLVYFSIRLFRTQHPQPVLFGGSGSGLEPTMRAVLFFCWFTFMALMVVLVRGRYRLERLRHETDELRFELEARAADREADGR